MTIPADALSADDVIAMLAMLKGLDPPLLVGGQALNILARYYRVAEFETQFSKDIDFVGDSEEAEQVALAWGAQIRIPNMDEYTPNTAILTIPRPGQKPLIIDFLESVAQNAFSSEVPYLDILEDGRPIRVLHPLTCLQSRLWNIYGPLARHSARDIKRAFLAIDVLRAHITALLDKQNIRGALKIIERLGKHSALSRVGKQAWIHDHIDVLKAIPADHPALSDVFQSTRWPAIQDRVKTARATAERLHQRSRSSLKS